MSDIDLSLRWQVIHGDCLDVMRQLPDGCVDAVVTDPPYGIGANKMALGVGRRDFVRGGEWDESRPDILSLLGVAPKMCVWGGNYFSDVLPPTNNWLVWHKKNDGRSFSEAELAWTNLGRNTRVFSHHWGGETKLHPTMKPVEVMVWCIAQADLPPDSLIIDPYCGSGTTGVAAVQLGHRFIGIEREASYVEIARRRIADAAAQGSLFTNV